ncbi:hypothetical protein BSKO_04080 [Bryopsis sp. KO-2023]|nr:hypothetical protein BSKO_04080 [Bryopsis sp. KO-2023]
MASTMTKAILGSPAALVAKPSRGQRVVVRAATNPSWCPGAARPAHLKGELVGDFGWDPLNLGSDPEALKYYVQAELVHARFAMMGLAGMLIPDILTHAGVANIPVWFEAGKVAQESSDIPFNALLMVQLFLMGWAEMKRYFDFKNPQSQGEPGSFIGIEAALAGTGENAYPGGVFDPLNYAKKADYEDLKLKEIKNGRLAMFATLGFYAQAAATGKGPVDNWLDHIADPWANNFATNGVSVPFL